MSGEAGKGNGSEFGIEVPDEYADVLTGDFAYDPVRLPIAEDPTQQLYDRKSLQKVWETKHVAENPFTRKWFDINSAIPQTALRGQMVQYIQRNGLPCDVIPHYTHVELSDREMRDYLNMLIRTIPLAFGPIVQRGEEEDDDDDEEAQDKLRQQWRETWKKLNLLRLYCQCRTHNREVFMSVLGFGYLFKIIRRVSRFLGNIKAGDEEGREVCREIGRIVDVICLRSSDMATLHWDQVLGLVLVLVNVYKNGEGYAKTRTMVLRIFRRIFHDCLDTSVEGRSYFLRRWVISIAILHLESAMNRTDTSSSEDLNHATAILRAAWFVDSKMARVLLGFTRYVNVVVDVVVLAVARSRHLHQTLNDPDELARLSHGQLHELRAQARHNCVCLEQALWMVNAIITSGHLHDRRYREAMHRLHSLEVVKTIVRMIDLLPTFPTEEVLNSTHLEFAFYIALALCQHGDPLSVINDDDAPSFRRLLLTDTLDGYDVHAKRAFKALVTCRFPSFVEQR